MAALRNAKRVVVKVGSALLVDGQTGSLRVTWLHSLVHDISDLRTKGVEVILVSSGSIALGRQVLGLGAEELTLEQSQAAAAIGQIRLARAYEHALAQVDLVSAQVLVTLEDTQDRKRYLNMRATLETLLSFGAVPIVNENDTIATDEIRYGDNDRLAAQVAITVEADKLVLLSDVEGLFTANPHVDQTAQHLPVVEKLTPELWDMAGAPVSGLSKGGMITKLMAAQIATDFGCDMCITLGHVQHPLSALNDGAKATWFQAQTEPETARKRWISALKPKGHITIDVGAQAALLSGGSLLPAGVLEAEGAFLRGDLVTIVTPSGERVGVGLIHYKQSDMLKIMGCQSSDIANILGYKGRPAVIHRDDLIVF